MGHGTLTAAQLAEKFGVCIDTIYTMVRRKEIPFFRLRRRIYFRAEAIEAWMKEQEEQNYKISKVV